MTDKVYFDLTVGGKPAGMHDQPAPESPFFWCKIVHFMSLSGFPPVLSSERDRMQAG